jgi:hypothetical protein
VVVIALFSILLAVSSTLPAFVPGESGRAQPVP